MKITIKEQEHLKKSVCVCVRERKKENFREREREREQKEYRVNYSWDASLILFY